MIRKTQVSQKKSIEGFELKTGRRIEMHVWKDKCKTVRNHFLPMWLAKKTDHTPIVSKGVGK